MKQPSPGNKICDLRNQKGITQKELADQCNVDIRTIQRIESDEVVPRMHTLRLLADALGCDISYFNENTHTERLLQSPIKLSIIAGVVFSINCIPVSYNAVNNSFNTYLHLFTVSIHIIAYVGFSRGFFVLGTALKNQMLTFSSLLGMILLPLLNILDLLKGFHFFAGMIGTIYTLVCVNAIISGIGLLITGFQEKGRHNVSYYKAAGFIILIQSLMFLSLDLTIITFGLILSACNNLILLAILYSEYRHTDTPHVKANLPKIA
jgi:DNA-binding XRE family transcriptional regulator